MGELETIAFQIIAAVGNARSLYIEAIHEAAAGHLDEAERLMREGRASFHEGHAAHASLITAEAAGEGKPMSLILTHAEDQLMSAEAFGILAEEFITLYTSLHASGALEQSREELDTE